MPAPRLCPAAQWAPFALLAQLDRVAPGCERVTSRRAGGQAGGRTRGSGGVPDMLELRHVRAGYGAFTALWDVSLRVQAGEAVAVVGPNGAGKTTLMRVISGMIPLGGGELRFEGESLGGQPAHAMVAHGIAH